MTHTTVEPRPYQNRIVHQTLQMFGGTYRDASGAPVPAVRSVMIESPTGSGKTYMGLMIARALQQQTGAKIGWVAMRRNLLDQVRAENARHGFDVDLRTISMFDRDPPTDMDLLVADEGHHAAANSCVHLQNVIRPRWILGLTATPFRTDRVKLCFDAVVRDAGIHQLIQDGYLSPYEHYTIPEWEPSQLADFYCADPERWGKSIVYFHSVEECVRLHAMLRARGIASDVVTGSTDRESQLAAFRAGKLRVLVNCMVLAEGFDDPSLRTVWVRPSGKGPTIQMAGRVLRPFGDTIKQIVQCRQTRHPFTKTARPRRSFLWHGDQWRSLEINPRINLCHQNTRWAVARTPVELPKFLQRKRTRPRRVRRAS